MPRTPREARSSSALTEQPRPPTGLSVSTGSASVGGRPATHGVPETVTIERSPSMSSSPSVESDAVLSDGLRDGLGAAVVVAKRQMDHAVGLCDACPQGVKVCQPTSQRLGASSGGEIKSDRRYARGMSSPVGWYSRSRTRPIQDSVLGQLEVGRANTLEGRLTAGFAGEQREGHEPQPVDHAGVDELSCD